MGLLDDLIGATTTSQQQTMPQMKNTQTSKETIIDSQEKQQQSKHSFSYGSDFMKRYGDKS